MKYIVRINDKEYEVVVEKGQANLVNTTEVVAPAAPAAAPTQAAPAAAAPAPAAPEQAATQEVPVGQTGVKAPIPGTILSVAATPGKKVSKGDVLAILEAMKMENEITAPEDGVIAQVLVKKGAAVSTGDLMITIQ